MKINSVPTDKYNEIAKNEALKESIARHKRLDIITIVFLVVCITIFVTMLVLDLYGYINTIPKQLIKLVVTIILLIISIAIWHKRKTI